jgi:hypothetical protein
MPLIFLEPFSAAKAESQASEIRGLVAQEVDWLEEVQPSTVKAYNSRRRARRTVVHRTRSSELEAYIVKRDDVAIGIATVIAGQRVIHPTKGLYEGYDLDYWLMRGQRTEAHRTITSLLIGQFVGNHNASMALRRRALERTGPIFSAENIWKYKAIASVLVNHPNPAIGFEEVPSMVAVGEPAVLTTDIPDDPYGMSRDGKLAQLYTYTAAESANLLDLVDF